MFQYQSILHLIRISFFYLSCRPKHLLFIGEVKFVFPFTTLLPPKNIPPWFHHETPFARRLQNFVLFLFSKAKIVYQTKEATKTNKYRNQTSAKVCVPGSASTKFHAGKTNWYIKWPLPFPAFPPPSPWLLPFGKFALANTHTCLNTQYDCCQRSTVTFVADKSAFAAATIEFIDLMCVCVCVWFDFIWGDSEGKHTFLVRKFTDFLAGNEQSQLDFFLGWNEEVFGIEGLIKFLENLEL